MKHIYMNQPWYTLLAKACESESRQTVARRMGVSPAVVTQVLNGSGKYGQGSASTDTLSQKVLHHLGNFLCPFLTGRAGAPVSISIAQCRAAAHRAAPTSAPQAFAHWQACQTCTHRSFSAPVVLKPATPRARRRKDSSATPTRSKPCTAAPPSSPPSPPACESPSS